jgi:O-antigen ligase
LTGIKFQLNNTTDPNGHSLLQRIEYWKTAWQIIRKNWFLGVGTGDVQQAFDREYISQNSPLRPENRLRAHNSYLTIWISFGIIGLILFLWMLLSFLIVQVRNNAFIPTMFMLIAICTFFIEDTLETQMGVTFFAFFYGLYINSGTRNLKEPTLKS